VVHIDRFGNLVTDIPADWLPSPAPRLLARVGSHTAAQFAGHYEQIPPYGVAILIGSLGTLELAMNGEDLARRWGVTAGDAVQVRWH
jgi:hypothetical protein